MCYPYGFGISLCNEGKKRKRIELCCAGSTTTLLIQKYGLDDECNVSRMISLILDPEVGGREENMCIQKL